MREEREGGPLLLEIGMSLIAIPVIVLSLLLVFGPGWLISKITKRRKEMSERDALTRMAMAAAFGLAAFAVFAPLFLIPEVTAAAAEAAAPETSPRPKPRGES